MCWHFSDATVSGTIGRLSSIDLTIAYALTKLVRDGGNVSGVFVHTKRGGSGLIQYNIYASTSVTVRSGGRDFRCCTSRVRADAARSCIRTVR